MLANDLVAKLRDVVGDAGLITDLEDLLPFLIEQRGNYRGVTSLCVCPATTAETAQVVRILSEAGVAMVPQGGNTGLCGGAVPAESGDQVLINLRRLNRVRGVDPRNFTITVEAGCVLSELQAAAAAVDRLFPLSLAAEGSCQIGGNLATNAGGTQVLRYGNARDLVLGLEVVLPDGQVLDMLRGLRKDNTGYDLKHLFCGAEGTLGIITAAVLKLFPRPRTQVTGMLAVRDLWAAIEVLGRARAETGDAVTGFEYISRRALDFVLKHIPGTREPLPGRHDFYVLFEATSTAEPIPGERPGRELWERVSQLLERASEDGLIHDAVLAQSPTQSAELWRLRESVPEAQKPEGASLKHDVSVPVSRVAQFVEEATARVEQALPGVRVCAFGHVGDGNIHFNLTQPEGSDRATYLASRNRIARIVDDLVVGMGGSFSAEHGIGRLKRQELLDYRSPVEIDVMRRIKSVLDPKNLMNPGKVL